MRGSGRAIVGLSVALLVVLPTGVAGAGQSSSADSTIRSTPGGEAYGVRTVGTREGLSHDVAFALLQDRAGFVWVGTIDGLNRFDGRDFEVHRHDPEDPWSLSSSSVRGLQEGPGGDLWVRTEAGLDRLERRTGRFHRYPIRARRLARGPGGELLVAGHAGLFRYLPAEDRFETLVDFPVPGAAGAPSEADPVWGLAVDDGGGVWIGTEAGVLVRLDAVGGVSHWRSPWRQVLFLDPGPGRLWLGHAGGVGVFEPSGDSGEGFRPLPGIDGPALSVLPGTDGDPWIGGHGVVRLAGLGSWSTSLAGESRQEIAAVTVLEGEPAMSVWSMLRTRDEVVWLATSRGLRLLDPYAEPFRTYRHDAASPSSLSGDAVVAVAPGADGDAWVGTLGSGLSRLDPATGRARRYRARAGDPGALCGDEVWALHLDADGDVWAGTDGGLCVLDVERDRFAPVLLDPGAVGDERIVFVLAADRRGRLWAGTAAGLYAVDPADGGVEEVRLPGTGGSGAAVEGLAVGPDGSLWVGARGGNLYRVPPAGERIARFPLADDSRLGGSEGFWELLPRADGTLWLAGDRGLFVFDPADGDLRAHPTSRLLLSSAVYSITEDEGGRVWLGTADGLLRLGDQATEGAGVDGLGHLQGARHYTTADGLPPGELNRRAAARLPDGRLAFGTMGGLTLLDPAELRDNPHPPDVAITEVRRLRRDGPVVVDPWQRTTARLAHDDTGLVIRFAALTFASPRGAVRAYRLEGVDPEWVRAGADNEVRYPPLPPGTYRFQVRAANADGVWNHAGASLELIVPPPWWASPWFRIAAAVALLAGLVVAVRQVSTRRLRRRVRALELDREIRLERERISRDLHDNVGSRVSTMLSGIELARLTAREDAEGNVDGVLESLGEDARRTMAELRETVWSLHQDRVAVTELADRIREHCRQRQRHVRPTLEVDGPGEADAVLESARALHLFRIAQEAVSNALRHGDASAVRVRLDLNDARLLLEVRDDGTFREPGPEHRGLGLRGMRARARQIGARFELDTDEGLTRVRVELPLEAP